MVNINNYNEIINYPRDPIEKKVRNLILDIYINAVNSVDPYQIVLESVKIDSKTGILSINNQEFLLTERKIWIIGGGKAAGRMAVALEKLLKNFDYAGIICVPIGTKKNLNLLKIDCLECTHPLPSEQNFRNTNRIIELTKRINKEDFVIAIISGGGSSILSAPMSPVKIDELIELNKMLISSGMDIHQINIIRKHVSQIKGGKFALKIPSEIIVLVLSDVIGDNLDTIASGPFFPDRSTFKDAKTLLEDFKLWNDRVPETIKQIITKGVMKKIPETPKEDNEVFSRVFNYIIGSNKIACKNIISKSNELGYQSIFLSDMLEGDVNLLGKILGRIYRGFAETYSDPVIIVSGGEPTVNVEGSGIGGRNQELAAVILEEIMTKNFDICFISGATDGIDGNSIYAGALIDSSTLEHLIIKKLNLKTFQSNNNLTQFFEKLGGSLISTGPTGTNVMDLHIAIINSRIV